MHSFSVALLRRLLTTLDGPFAQAQLDRAHSEMAQPGFWAGPDVARVVADAAAAQARVALAQEAAALDVYEVALSDPDLAPEARQELAGLSARVEAVFGQCGHADAPALVTIVAGAGGEDARDFAALTVGETLAYAEQRGLEAVVVDDTYEGSGLRDATIRVVGPGAFRVMRGEAGKRRLVRQSPFGSGGRQTSFCTVAVVPESQSSPRVVPKSDLRIETYRDTGPGGQHRNTTDSAVRITHLPTGITAKSALRSQHENKRLAMITLLSRLEAHQEAKAAAKAQALRAGGGAAGFGGRARTLVLDPYQLVRNEATGESSADVAAYLRGGCFDVRAAFGPDTIIAPENFGA